MKLIADSGSTKTDWCLLDGGTVVREFKTPGMNPCTMSEEAITQRIMAEVKPNLTEVPAQIFFYGAGCNAAHEAPMKRMLEGCLGGTAEVASDLLGAARAVCGDKPGIVGILGTGSNSGDYDGKMITAHMPPLGYILGDEGSGTALGKALIVKAIRGDLNRQVTKVFFEETGLDEATIINKVYREPEPNKFLASLTYFLAKYREIPDIMRLLLEKFREYFLSIANAYDTHNKQMFLVGSLTSVFAEEVQAACSMVHLDFGGSISHPMEGLISYYSR